MFQKLQVMKAITRKLLPAQKFMKSKQVSVEGSAIHERCLTIKSDKLSPSKHITKSLHIEISSVTNLFSHIEEKEAEGHSTLLIKYFNVFKVDRSAVMFQIRCQSLKKSFNLYIIPNYFIGEQT